jgi:circadian clock protein KaiC
MAKPYPLLQKARPIPKALTGIRGLDDVTNGGLPKGRPTLVCGAAGCGKTLLAMEFLFRGAAQLGEPGVFLAFEETKKKLISNAASLGFDLEGLVSRKMLALDYVHVDRSEIEETGEYDLGGLFARLEYHVKAVRAKRIVLDTIEVLFAGLKNEGIIRSELRRLFRWIEDRGLTAVITAERGEGQLTRHGLEEYVSDCVIVLDHRVSEELSTRRLRILKYRGSSHGTNEYPFLIDEQGISVVPVTSLGLAHQAPTDVVASGVAELDVMLGGKGFFRGSTILVSGTAGTGKTSLAASFVRSSCERGESAVYFSLEESPQQILRNMNSVGIPLERWIRKGLLEIQASRPTMYGLEMHLANLYKHIENRDAKAVVVDPVTSLMTAGNAAETRSLLIRLIDLLKSRGITAFLTSLTAGGAAEEASDVGISSLIDTWIVLSDSRVSGERNRTLQIVKSRGMAHSNQVREFLLNNKGVRLRDVYLGEQGVLTGSARLAQEAIDRAKATGERLEAERQEIARVAEETALAAQISASQAKLQALANERERLSRVAVQREGQAERDRQEMAASRKSAGMYNGNDAASRRRKGRARGR